jgi:lipoprotein-releasing system ATP-binding protein
MNNNELKFKTKSTEVVLKAKDISKSFAEVMKADKLSKKHNLEETSAENVFEHSAETSVVSGRVQVLAHCNIELHQGELLAIVGSSGSGKSTLMHLLGGLDRPDEGKVFIEEQNLADLNENDLAALRNQKLGFVYQFHHLLHEFSALENVAMPLILRRLPHREALNRASVVLDRVGLAHREHHVPGQLSGGERQRVAIARALVTEPRCVLADEPTGNLDRKTATQVFDLILQLNKELGIAFALVTHDNTLAQRCDRVLQMQEGRLQ